MTTSSKQDLVIKAVTEKINSAVVDVGRCRAELDLVNHPMCGFKPEDNDYPEIDKKTARDRLERAQERLSNLKETLDYMTALFKEN